MKRETESLLTVPQDQALRANYIKNKIDRQDVSVMYRLFGEREASVSHVTARKLLKTSKRTGDTISFLKLFSEILRLGNNGARAGCSGTLENFLMIVTGKGAI